jgi:6-phosphogluconolactonase
VTPRRHSFVDGTALAVRLADDVAASLARRLRADGRAGLVLSGGRTPVAFLRALGAHELDWRSVRITLADERCVAADSPASNLRLLRESFAGTAAAAAVLPAFDMTAAAAAQHWRDWLAQLPRPFAAVVLGMGDDGHFASLFPHMPGLAPALDPRGAATVVHGLAPVAPQSRLSLTLAALLETDLLALHITGASKLAVLERAQQTGSELDLPVRALLRQDRASLEVYHAP